MTSLSKTSSLRLLGVLALVLAPHLLRLPPWESALLVVLMLWRAAATYRHWRLPPTPLKVALTLASFAGVWLEYRQINGHNAGVALLAAMLVLKLTELRERRDVFVLVFMMYFLLLTHFLFTQELWTFAYLLGGSIAITAVLIDVSHERGTLPLRASLSLAVTMMLQALPLMLLLFVLFPRVPGPLWGLPADAGPSRTGLPDTMSPGDIASLVPSDEIAFRVRFDGSPPREDQLYWRGPVFWFFDGRTWRPGSRASPDTRVPAVELRGPAVGYEILLEPMRTRWLFALDLPDPARLPPDAALDMDYQLLAPADVRDRRLYHLYSHVQYRLDDSLLPAQRERLTRLPAGANPRTIALAQRWQHETGEPEALIDRALAMFRQQPFWYTLEPGVLGRDSVDAFLFDTRRGFCEHYASAFTVLMRAAGLPARVVTGYQGGSLNVFGDGYVVRQSDAHAWSEVWIDGRGWLRVDPTRAVAPERVERGARAVRGAGAAREARLAGGWDWQRLGYAAEARWEWANGQWNRWVLAYSPDLQSNLLSRIGLGSPRAMVLALTVGIIVVLAALGLWLAGRRCDRIPRERSALLWDQLQRHLRRHGLEPRLGEGPRDYAQRVVALHPQLREPMREALAAYLQARYEHGGADPAAENRLQQALQAMRRRGAQHAAQRPDIIADR